MGRTRLRGIELAGLRIAVEVPSMLDWRDRDSAELAASCGSQEPDVYVGVRVGETREFDLAGTVYATGRQTFEIGRIGCDWIVAVHGEERCERVARFDSEFAVGEVIVSPRHAARLLAIGGSPLDHPLDELVVLHRLLRTGGLVLRGSLVVKEGRALAFVGSRCEVAASEGDTTGWRRIDPIRAAGDRVAIGLVDDVVVAHTLPWSVTGAPVPRLRAVLDAIHLLERADAVYTEPLDEAEATGVILENSFAPVHDPDGVARSGVVAERLSRRIPVVRLGMPEERRVVPFTWGQSEAALAFAPPI